MATFSDTGVRSHSKRLTPPIPKTNPYPAVKPNENPGIYLDFDLKTPKLNDIHKRLWLAGLPRAARPLHRQKLLGRNILVTEDPDEHLVWFESQIFIKPLPIYLLHHDYWLEHVCSDQSLHQSACGLLLSYAWLVCYNSDLEIAKEAGLLPKCIEWTSWVKFIENFLDNVDLTSLDGVNKRYIYGELRLSRLNAIYRFLPPSYSFKMLVRGYRAGSTWYNAFFERHFKWMLAVFAALSVLLSAFQVGLATSSLQGNLPFQNASYGFTVGSLLAVVAAVDVVVFVWLGLFCYHFVSTWQNDRTVDCKRRASLTLS
ncbi:hypothetical protein BS50DRAFT_64650 [Corynespora cassiicola Philippines]|uniref:Uncharacterized protein n=1 Tax=Corynespora cassiicola Philippines TaxID=1448308 RepID=A0A2T2N063_CORCC|nr:hypothetical protein BS50DRAFT_64650 [Corynespora cassiicola Philippines]